MRLNNELLNRFKEYNQFDLNTDANQLMIYLSSYLMVHQNLF